MVSKTAEGGVLAGKRSLVALVRAVPVELKEELGRVWDLQRLILLHYTCVGLKAMVFDKLKLKKGYIVQKKMSLRVEGA